MFQAKPLIPMTGRTQVLRRRLIVTVIDLLVIWVERASSRRALLKLDDRMLEDIGVSRVDAVREARKPFWRA